MPPQALESRPSRNPFYRLLAAPTSRRLALAPGDRLFLEGLAARYGVSMTPIRQALRRLEAEGLVVSVPRRGARVAPLTVAELEEIQLVRLGLEPFLARHGAEACTDRRSPRWPSAARRWSTPTPAATSRRT